MDKLSNRFEIRYILSLEMHVCSTDIILSLLEAWISFGITNVKLFLSLDYEIATFEERTKIKNIGCRYIVFCLECVYILGKWLPKDELTKG